MRKTDLLIIATCLLIFAVCVVFIMAVTGPYTQSNDLFKTPSAEAEEENPHKIFDGPFNTIWRHDLSDGNVCYRIDGYTPAWSCVVGDK